MIAVGTTYLNIADGLKQQEDNGKKTAGIIELLARNNDMLLDATVVECNDGTSHKSTIRTGLPSATWTQLYGYTQPSKATTAQVRDNTGMLKSISVVDPDLVKLQPNPNQFRLNEAMAHLEAMNQEMQDTVIYGSVAADPAKWDGLALRYNGIATSTTNINSNVIDAGGSGDDNTSIWFITWGELHTSLIYPKGMAGGLEHIDDGLQFETDATGGKRAVLQDRYNWNLGLTVRDWRSTCRVANLDLSLMQAGSVEIEDFMLDAYYQIEQYAKTGKTIIYANKQTSLALHKRAKDKTNVHLDIADFAGKQITTFMGLPIRRCDAILNSESHIT